MKYSDYLKRLSECIASYNGAAYICAVIEFNSARIYPNTCPNKAEYDARLLKYIARKMKAERKLRAASGYTRLQVLNSGTLTHLLDKRYPKLPTYNAKRAALLEDLAAYHEARGD